MIQPESDGLNVVLDRSNHIFSRVRMPREAALDSELLCLIAMFGSEQANRLQAGLVQRDFADLITKLKTTFKKLEESRDNVNGNEKEDSDESEESRYDWVSLGHRSKRFIRKTPTIDGILGPLGIIPPERKERKKIVREKLGERTAPEEVAPNRELTQEELDQDARKRVEIIRKKLEETGKTNFFNFIVDPDSFTQTIENIFHYSFLVKDGQAAVMVQQEVPFAGLCLVLSVLGNFLI